VGEWFQVQSYRRVSHSLAVSYRSRDLYCDYTAYRPEADGYGFDHTWIREALKILLPICSHP
jgi:hypothetical protein